MSHLHSQPDTRQRWGGSHAASHYYSPIDPSSGKKLKNTLLPLLDLLQIYDRQREQLEYRGGNVHDLQRISVILNKKITLQGPYQDYSVHLSNPTHLNQVLKCLNYQLHLDIRQRQSGMPVYYLNRTYRDYWGEYSLIVEDLYQSESYPFSDSRFVRLMDFGHEVFFLRLAHFRRKVQTQLGRVNRDSVGIDNFLYDLGRYVFQAAWHEDQRLAVAVADHCNLRSFTEAIYLLYLILGGELCELRNAITPGMVDFFTKVYPVKPLQRFLPLLPELDGDAINKLPKRAAIQYKKLIAAFREFLSTKILWGYRGFDTPLWKIIYANFSRLSMIEEKLRKNTKISNAGYLLQARSKTIIDAMLEK